MPRQIRKLDLMERDRKRESKVNGWVFDRKRIQYEKRILLTDRLFPSGDALFSNNMH